LLNEGRFNSIALQLISATATWRAVACPTADRLVVTRLQQYLLESLTKFNIEDGVDEWIQKAVDVTEPDEQRERHRVNVAHADRCEEVVAHAHGVDDVQREERNPAQQEYTCKEYCTVSAVSRAVPSIVTAMPKWRMRCTWKTLNVSC
jgi:hypothetical protein